MVDPTPPTNHHPPISPTATRAPPPPTHLPLERLRSLPDGESGDHRVGEMGREDGVESYVVEG
jgi:hypothetical protein